MNMARNAQCCTSSKIVLNPLGELSTRFKAFESYGKKCKVLVIESLATELKVARKVSESFARETSIHVTVLCPSKFSYESHKNKLSYHARGTRRKVFES